MKICIYTPGYNQKLTGVLKAFAEGLPGVRQVMDQEEFDPLLAGDIGVVFGWYKYAYKPTMSKKPIIEHYLAKGKHRLIVIESGFQLRGDYYQVGWDNFAGAADHCASDAPLKRFNNMGLQLQPWKDEPGRVVLMGQLGRDTQVQDTDHYQWCRDTMAALVNKYGDKARFRPHPREKDPSVYGIPFSQFDEYETLHHCLNAAELVVTYNSTSGTDAILAGVPCVAMSSDSFSWDVSSHSLDEEIARPDRTRWAARLGYAQWSLDEMRRGLPWLHLARSMR